MAARKLGPLPVWGWAAVGGGTFLVYVLYRRYKAGSATAPNLALTGGTSIPTSGTTTTTGSGTSLPTTLAQWEADALSMMTGPNYSAAQAFNDLTAWLSGQPVSAAGYNALSAALAQLGAPPGINAPPITVAANTPAQPAPTLQGFGGLGVGSGLFGTAQIAALTAAIGQGNITAAEVNDVINAFDAFAAQYGLAAAQQQHYDWHSPGVVTTMAAPGNLPMPGSISTQPPGLSVPTSPGFDVPYKAA
jgi:hypothetical protein